MAISNVEGPSDRIVGIDALRAIAALTVMFGHLNLVPPTIFSDHSSGPLAWIRMTSNCLFNGPAAVIVFFVISGLCIHLPQTRSNRKFEIRRFYLRRGLRIGPPAIFALAAYDWQSHTWWLTPNQSVLWSVECEVIYYFLYPGFLLLTSKIRWEMIIFTAYFAALGLCLTHLQTVILWKHAYPAFGSFNWLLGLPCWLLGCWLAEHRSRFHSITLLKIWVMRIFVFLVVFFLTVAKFHLPYLIASNCFTLNAFAFLAVPWIGMEVSFARNSTTNIFEGMGRWSYSLYLMHPVAPTLLAVFGVAEARGSWFYHILLITLALFMSYLFYLAIEKPSHQLAASITLRKKMAFT